MTDDPVCDLKRNGEGRHPEALPALGRDSRTTPWYSPISTPNSAACRSGSQRAFSGKVKNMRPPLSVEVRVL